MFASWTRADVLTTVGIGVAVIVGIACIWAALFSTQFQEWWKRKDEGEGSLSLNLSGAMPYKESMPRGIARTVERAFAEITEALPESSMLWLHEKDFGNSFYWGMIEFLERFSWLPEVAARSS